MWLCVQRVQLPADGIAVNFAGDDVEAVVGTVPPTEGQISEARRPIKSGMNKRRNQKRYMIIISFQWMEICDYYLETMAFSFSVLAQKRNC